jgi:hypothetical protein
MQFEKEHPSINTRFTLQRPDPVSASIAHKGTSLTVPAMQAAVWMQTDNITFTQMSHKFPITPEDWAAGEDVFLQCRRQAESMTNVVSMNSGKSTGDEK